MNELPKIFGSSFSENKNLRRAVIATCPKCGIRCEDDMIAASISTTTGSNDLFQQTITFKGNISTKHVVDSFGEFLARNCLVCGYSWEDVTMDTLDDVEQI